MRDDYPAILERIKTKVEERFGSRDEGGQSVVYRKVGIDRANWSRKMRGQGEFNRREIAGIAEAVDAPRGWPYISWDDAIAAIDVKGALDRERLALKERELAVKEREIALREKELELRERLAASGDGITVPPKSAAPSSQPERPTKKAKK